MKADKYHHISDQQLLENFYASNDNKWLGILLERFTLLLLGVCMKYLKNEEEAKDSVQQIFLKTITELHKYRVEYFKSWIYTVAKNHCLMKLRSRQHKTPSSLDETLTISADTEPDIYALLQNEKTIELMKAALIQLNKEQRQCVTLFYIQKKSYQKICDHTGYSLLQVKSYIQNGKRNMKIFIDRNANDDVKK